MTIPIGASLTPGTFTGTAANKNNNTATDTATSIPILTAATVNQST